MSRINWLLIPATLFILIYFLENDSRNFGQKRVFEYLHKPFTFLISGLVGGIIGYAGIYLFSSSETAILSSAFSSPLLISRLFLSNGVYPSAIIDILLLSLPLLIIIISSVYKQKDNIIRLASIGIILLFYFIGSVIVSSKIGGGSGIHNFDTFILLLIITLIPFSERIISKSYSNTRINLAFFLFLTLILYPSYRSIKTIKFIPTYDFEFSEKSIDHIQGHVDSYENVFLGNQQHLILFNHISNLEFDPLTEKTLLMEAIVSENVEFLDQVILDDIRSKKFDLLLLEEQAKYIKTIEETFFAEENNFIFQYFSSPVYGSYHIEESLYKSIVEEYTRSD